MAIPAPHGRQLWLLDRHRPTSEIIATEVCSVVPEVEVEIFTSPGEAEQAFSTAEAHKLPVLFGTDLVGVTPLRGEDSPTVATTARLESPLTTIALFSAGAYGPQVEPGLVDRLYREGLIDLDVRKPDRTFLCELIVRCLRSWDAPELVFLRSKIGSVDDPWLPIIPDGSGKYLSLIEVYRLLAWGGPAAVELRPVWQRLATPTPFAETFPEA